MNFRGIINLDSAYLAKSPNGECYLAILTTGTNTLVKIYKIGESSSYAEYTFRGQSDLNDFRILRDGSFYLEFGNSDGIQGSARIISTNNYEESIAKTVYFLRKEW